MREISEELHEIVAGFRAHLAHRGRSGLLGVPAAVAARRPASVLAPIVKEGPDAPGGGQEARPVVPGATGLAQIRDELGDCRRCGLAGTRRQIVFGVGNPAAPLVFVGEAPGADEDSQGEPFVGKAGQLLTKMIEAMGFTRQDVYIVNVLKCRPPGNRDPLPQEVAACEPFLQKQLAAIRPRVIVALGRFAVQCLLRDSAPISRLRGQWRTYQGIRLMPTFHPAFLLRDPGRKREAWADLKEVLSALAQMGIVPPAGSSG